MYNDRTSKFICIILAITASMAMYQNINLIEERERQKIQLNEFSAEFLQLSKQIDNFEKRIIKLNNECFIEEMK